MLSNRSTTHENDGHSATLTSNNISAAGTPKSPQLCTVAPGYLGLVVVLASHFLSANAAVLPLTVNNLSGKTAVERRDAASGHTVSLQIWAPVLGVGAVIVLLTVGLCLRRSITTWIARQRASSVGTNGPTTRELTAEQLAGTINSAAAPTANNGGNRTRRTRRPRRTPSQISTTSLPAYAKEPGEQELVIFRGPEDMEDAGMPPATVVMDALSEDGEESLHSRNSSRTSQYPQLPATPVDEPLLLQNDQLMQPPGNVMPRRSIETLDSSEEASSLMRIDSNAPPYNDPRGEAPPYFEAIPLSAAEETSALPLPNTRHIPPPEPEPVPPRRSGFRSLLHSLPNRLSIHGSSSHTPSHSRADSSFSMVSSENSHGREQSHSRASHRPSGSGSGSLLSLTPFRTLSRQKSQTNINLNSPSLISLNSISSPLSHTLTRTEFTYPKSGPTPEQLKLISSRESFARFGVPYGADAIAYAASTSRHDLAVPPPDFDASPPPSTNGQQTQGTAGPSRLRTSSNAADLRRNDEDSVSPDTSFASDITPSLDPLTRDPQTSDQLSQSFSVDGSASFGGSNPVHIPLPSSPEGTSTQSPAQVDITPLVLPKPSTVALSTPDPTNSGKNIPPTSFRAPSTFEDRSVSRASSVGTFATARESMASRSPSRSDFSEDEDEVGRSTTPKMGTRHLQEPSDATIKQSPAVATGSSV